MKKTLAIFGLIGIGVVGRLVPHAPNATPITAITITARKHVGRVWSFIIPVAAMLLSDVFIGFYNWRILISVYGSFLLIACMGQYMRKNANARVTVVFAVMSSLLFFLVTNFAVWMFSPWYAKSIWGLLYCYQLGIPFLRNMLVGDVAYTALLLGVFGLAPSKAKLLTGFARNVANRSDVTSQLA